MLKRLYVDNYKCLTNFELPVKQLHVLLGANGTGKSTVFDVLDQLRRFAAGEGATLAKDLFKTDSLTRWERRPEQTFELTVTLPEGEFVYRLALLHEPERRWQVRVHSESLTADGAELFGFTEGEVQLRRNDGSPGPRFPAEWQRSALANVVEHPDNARLRAFRDGWLRRVQVVRLNPHAMQSGTQPDDVLLATDGGNYASWFRHLQTVQAETVYAVNQRLGEILDGRPLLHLKPGPTGGLVLLASIGGNGTGRCEYRFDELSEGQRVLAALYTLLQVAAPGNGPLVCFDEPVNYVSLHEVRPWAAALRMEVEENGGQALLASHHPEVINEYAPDDVAVLVRENAGPTRVKAFESVSDDALTPAEVVVRGLER